MRKFAPVEDKTVLEDKQSVREIDYSFLLTHVFGETVRAEQAFMYLFRRYGLPNGLPEDHKDLGPYIFHTADKDIIVAWYIILGDYHDHLYAFADAESWARYAVKPRKDWHKELRNAAEKDGGVYFGGCGVSSGISRGEDGKLFFEGNDIQKKHANSFLANYSESDAEKAWSDLDKRIRKNDEEVEKKYRSLLPCPEIESKCGKSFSCQFDRQVEAGKEQDEWIRSLPEGHFLRRVYFAAAGLFESWKRPVRILCQDFNMTCKNIARRRRNYER
jgi:hypothetical protein